MTKIWYTDGSCRGNPGPGGWSALILNGNELEHAAYHIEEENTTNNKMELSGILYATSFSAKNPNIEYMIFSDSNYCVRIINEWMRNWCFNEWTRSKGQPIENLELIKTLWSYYSQPFFNVGVKWIKGHNNLIGNELADKLANRELNEFYNLLEKNKITYQKQKITQI